MMKFVVASPSFVNVTGGISKWQQQRFLGVLLLAQAGEMWRQNLLASAKQTRIWSPSWFPNVGNSLVGYWRLS
jgi:hypothetical protein